MQGSGSRSERDGAVFGKGDVFGDSINFLRLLLLFQDYGDDSMAITIPQTIFFHEVFWLPIVRDAIGVVLD